jgi:hypothetical protein
MPSPKRAQAEISQKSHDSNQTTPETFSSIPKLQSCANLLQPINSNYQQHVQKLLGGNVTSTANHQSDSLQLVIKPNRVD